MTEITEMFLTVGGPILPAGRPVGAQKGGGQLRLESLGNISVISVISAGG